MPGLKRVKFWREGRYLLTKRFFLPEPFGRFLNNTDVDDLIYGCFFLDVAVVVDPVRLHLGDRLLIRLSVCNGPGPVRCDRPEKTFPFSLARSSLRVAFLLWQRRLFLFWLTNRGAVIVRGFLSD